VLVGLVDNILAAAGIIVGDRQGAGDAETRDQVTTSECGRCCKLLAWRLSSWLLGE
jgi:hypothetical protein